MNSHFYLPLSYHELWIKSYSDLLELQTWTSIIFLLDLALCCAIKVLDNLDF